MTTTKREQTIRIILNCVFIIVFLAIALGVRLLLAGGEWSCILSPDPAVCAAVKELGR
jgi:hypothetical protein